MGFDPTRPFRARRLDYVLVAVAALVCVALVAWGLFG